ncbi:MAG: hypothetical protein OEZ04_08590, partial [Nitrospinota bacterium]|nr:hypothetical protein [Nitrospinota bacterium]
MTRRYFPTLAAFGLGLAALAWGLASLQLVFVRERAEAAEELQARRTALTFYAGKTLHTKLAEAMERSLKRIHVTAEDPLMPDDGLLLMKGGRQVLPRPIRFMEGTEVRGSLLYKRLVKADYTDLDDEPDSPWGKRVELFGRFAAALGMKDNERIA